MEEARGSLETSLLHLVEDHNHQFLQMREVAEKSKNASIRAAERVSELLVDTVDGGVQESFTNEKLMENEIRALAITIARYSKQTNQWLAASRAMNSVLKEIPLDVFLVLDIFAFLKIGTSLKEIGDFENWMKVMDYDCKSINAALTKICQP